MSKAYSFKIKHVLYAEPVKVFDALTKESSIEKWGGGKAMIEPRENGNFEMFDGWVKGHVIEFKPGRLFSFTWKPREWKPKTDPSKVEFVFSSHEAGTEIQISHTGFPDQEEAEKHKEGWINFVLEPLNDFLLQTAS